MERSMRIPRSVSVLIETVYEFVEELIKSRSDASMRTLLNYSSVATSWVERTC